MKKKWIEFICDCCGCSDYYPMCVMNVVNAAARENG